MVVAMSSIPLDHPWPVVDACGLGTTIEPTADHSAPSTDLRTISAEANVVELSGDEVFDMYTGDDHTVTEDEDNCSIKEDIVPFDFEDDGASQALPVFEVLEDSCTDDQVQLDTTQQAAAIADVPRRVSLCLGPEVSPSYAPHGVVLPAVASTAPVTPCFPAHGYPPRLPPMPPFAHHPTTVPCRTAPYGSSRPRTALPREYRAALHKYAETMKHSEYSRRQVILGRRRLRHLYAGRVGQDDLLSGEPWGRSLDYQLARRELVSDIYSHLLEGMSAGPY